MTKDLSIDDYSCVLFFMTIKDGHFFFFSRLGSQVGGGKRSQWGLMISPSMILAIQDTPLGVCNR